MNQPGANFIRAIIENDLAQGKNDGKVVTRFPPEPNGYLHLGHVKSICLNFGMAEEFHGRCNLRFDDSNPEKENTEYMQAIQNDVHWLGFEWAELKHASDYFQQLFDGAIQLIKLGLAYVDSQDGDSIRAQRGSLTEPGVESPFRHRSIEENLDLFQRMNAGEFPDGSHVLRAKIDMSSPNINLRDPVIYRIRHAEHFHTGNRWKVYPMYDYTHCMSDMIEGITHSLCTLEFEDHRPLYDWFLNVLHTPCHPQQIEFSRLNMEYTVLSKRRLIQLVQQKHVRGWDDPRMPTIAGFRRRGVPAAALREFCRRLGISKSEGVIELSYLEGIIRDQLNQDAPRRMAVLKPLKVVISNWQGEDECLTLANHPQNDSMGTRQVRFGRELYIEHDDFSETPPRKWKRLAPGEEVRLRGSYTLRCDEVIKDSAGRVCELRCSYDPDTLGKNPPDRKVNGVIHWVNAADAIQGEVRHYETLFNRPDPMAAEDFLSALNPNSLQIIQGAMFEPAAQDVAGSVFQFERLGYYAVDPDSQPNHPVFNLTISLRQSH